MTINKLLEEELVHTNNIESVHTDRKSVREILEGKDVGKNYREKQIVQHYLHILTDQLVFDDAKDVSKLYYQFLQDYIDTCDLLHMDTLFRKESVNVVTGTNKIIHTGIEGEENIKNAIDTITDYLHNSNENIFIKVAAFHYFFGYIHPFYDGNGRIIRLITAAKLFPKLSIASLAISDVISHNQSLYYQRFDDTNSQFNVNDITSFVYNFLEFIDDALNKTLYHLKHNNQLIVLFTTFLDTLDLHKTEKYCLLAIYQASLIGELLCANQIAVSTKLSLPTVAKYTTSLESKELLIIDRTIKPNKIKLSDTLLHSISKLES